MSAPPPSSQRNDYPGPWVKGPGLNGNPKNNCTYACAGWPRAPHLDGPRLHHGWANINRSQRTGLITALCYSLREPTVAALTECRTCVLRSMLPFLCTALSWLQTQGALGTNLYIGVGKLIGPSSVCLAIPGRVRDILFFLMPGCRGVIAGLAFIYWVQEGVQGVPVVWVANCARVLIVYTVSIGS